jgi:outer membrane protein OmpA-like peptidoglycan-associated protein
MKGARPSVPAAIIGALLLVPLDGRCVDAGPPGAVVSKRDIEAALTPTSSAPADSSPQPKTRGIVIKAAEEKKAVIDLNIPFELNSAVLQPRAVAQLEQLDAALESAALGGSRFVIAGHTDSSGDADYNQRLSIRRAEAVRQYLVSHGVSAQRLEVAGFGKDQPLTPEDPGNALNRRVEIRNLGAAP